MKLPRMPSWPAATCIDIYTCLWLYMYICLWLLVQELCFAMMLADLLYNLTDSLCFTLRCQVGVLIYIFVVLYRKFVFFNVPQIQYKNPWVQVVMFKNMTPSPFLKFYLGKIQYFIFFRTR